MASVAATDRRTRRLAVRAVSDRTELRRFLDVDRLFAAYAICDLEEKEFAKTRWGGAYDGDRLVALGLEYTGLTPQPLFVMGRPEGIEAILRDIVRPRSAYVAVLPEALPAVESVYRLDSGPPMVRMWVDRARFRPFPADVRRLFPSNIGELNRLYQLGFASWLPSSAIADGVYFGVYAGGRLVAAAGTHVISRAGSDRGRRQRPHPPRPSRTRSRDRGHRRRHRRAVADLRPGRPQRSLGQSPGAPGVPAARLRRARPVRGTPRPSPRIAVAGLHGAASPLLQPQGDRNS